ncbi:MAG: 4-hydroxy-tetrahydrodipicolinate synthase [Phycisphaerae bacterium SM23_33]|jgi:4-hydroxy-tetrahydrodipicolinate synthase|nr:MAG: 4-hydroxy-tetrahydrodipicolinate synthase [Phycisphaerae bacterium SM23_33]
MPKRIKLEGSMVALVTPFRKGEVDWDALGELIDFQLANGTQGLVPCGTTGESPTLGHEEHDAVVEFTIRRAAGRVPVIAGTGSNSTAEALQLTRHAREAGADACLVVNPYYNKPTQQGMFEHVAELAKIGLPIVLYNIPSRTGIELATDTIVRMYNQIEQVVAIKEATGKLDNASALACRCDITILSGDDSLTLPIGSVGGRGVISVLANILPAEVRKLTDAMLAGEMEAATKQHLRLFPLIKAIFVETNPIPIKAALAMAGKIKNELRLPLLPLSQEHDPMLAELLRPFGVEAKP